LEAIRHAIVPLDHSLRLWVVTHRVNVLDALLWFASVVGRGGIVWLVIGVVLTAMRRVPPSALIELGLAILLATLLTDDVLKPIVSRDRPFTSTPHITVIGGRPKDSSFPSGHAANALAGAYVLSRIAPAGRLAWWALAAAIVYSRVYLGVHYPLDVTVGALIGCCCGFVAGRILARLSARRVRQASR
jgi:undecaprenyl-diphosphatase